MEFMQSNQLLQCTGAIVATEKAFRNKRIVLLYFGAAWCTQCRHFLPKLKELYNKAKEMHLRLEIIYVSMDEEEEEMTTNFLQRHGGWYAVPHGDPALWVLRVVYGINEIPSIVVLGEGGAVISRNGMGDYDKYGIDVLVAWNSTPPR